MPRQKGIRIRHEYLIEYLKRKHTVHCLEWEVFSDNKRDLLGALRSFNYSFREEDGVIYHHIARMYDLKRRLSREKANAFFLNEKLFKRQIRYIEKAMFCIKKSDTN